MRQEPHSIPHQLSEDVFYTLEICKGKTQFPQRPVIELRFLIGAGAGCDLRLGGDDIPPLHTILIVSEGQLTAETIAGQPLLQINGRNRETAVLQDGDLLEVGPFHFVVHINHDRVTRLGQDSQSRLIDSSDEFENSLLPETSELSASQLIDRIEEEFQFVEEFEQKVDLGEQTLLNEIAARSKNTVVSPAPSSGQSTPPASRHFIHNAHELVGPTHRGTELELVREFERVRRELESFSGELDKRYERVTKREAHFDEAAKDLVNAQHKLTDQLALLLEQIESHEVDEAPRAIA